MAPKEIEEERKSTISVNEDCAEKNHYSLQECQEYYCYISRIYSTAYIKKVSAPAHIHCYGVPFVSKLVKKRIFNFTMWDI